MNWLHSFINLLFYALNLAILIRVVISWLSINPHNPFVSLIYQVTDPILEPLRRIIPPVGMIDVTPIVAMLLLSAIQGVLLGVISGVMR